MNAQKIIFPGTIFVILFLYFFTGLISSPRVAWASSNPVENISSSPPTSIYLSMKFPQSIQKWKDLIEIAAKNNNLNPNLIASVIMQESGGDPSAFSSSGAVGLMQVMPSDGLAANFLCEGVPCFQNRPTIQSLFDPEFNINFGSSLLTGLINKYQDWREGLFAYGPYNIGYSYADIVLQIYSSYQ